MRKKVGLLLLIIFTVILCGCTNNAQTKKEINISVAASLLDPMTKIAEIYEKYNNVKVNINSGGSGTLKKQISEGADVGLFFSANEKYVDQLISEGLASEANKVDEVFNKLVLIKSNNATTNISDIKDLANFNGKIAIGEPGTVPAGQYAKETLESLGIWNDIESKIVYCKDVTAVKTYVEKGEVDYGFVYKSDAINLKDSSILEEIDDSLHSPINYSLIPINGYKYSEECKALINLILSDEGKAILKEYGFEVKE